MRILCFFVCISLLGLPLFSEEPSSEWSLVERIKEEDPGFLGNRCRIIFLRHGETEWNVKGKSQGWTDIPLNEKGRQQAREVARHLADLRINTFYASSLSRAEETAQIIAASHPNPTFIFDPTLRFFRKDRSLWLDLFKSKKTKKKEMKKEIAEDSIAYLKELSRKHPGETVVVVSHRSVVNRLFLVLSSQVPSKKIFENGEALFIIGDGETLFIEQ